MNEWSLTPKPRMLSMARPGTTLRLALLFQSLLAKIFHSPPQTYRQHQHSDIQIVYTAT